MAAQLTVKNHKIEALDNIPENSCECADSSLYLPTKMAMSRKPTDDFVPLESVLEDVTDISRSPSVDAKKQCCLHGLPCIIATSRESVLSSDSSVATNGRGCLKRGMDGCCTYYMPLSSESVSDQNALDKIREDYNTELPMNSKWKTRWPLMELLSEINLVNKNGSDESVNVSRPVYPDYQASSSTTAKSCRRKSKVARNNVASPVNTPNLTVSSKESVKSSENNSEVSVSLTGINWKTDSSYQKKSNVAQPPGRQQKQHIFSTVPYSDVGVCRQESSQSSSSTKSLRSAASEETIERASDLELVCRYYIGHKTRKDAEKDCFAPDSFFLYHQLPENDCNVDLLRKCIRLFLLYISPKGTTRHYAILRQQHKNGIVYSVCCNQKKIFASLTELVRFYARNKVFTVDGKKQRFPE
uniref:SH2 domain-containing protein n=1 Tax=Panagrolaimus sp. JU765 TaxID=591449 RepID=A0AC34QMD1_9BILA